MSRRLLLADDSVTIQKVIEITLSDKDYILQTASDGDEALQLAKSEKPDLILADVFMPGKDGYAVCAAVRSNPKLHDVPVLLLAGTFEPFDQKKAKEVGANGWIVKPFSSQALIDKVEEMLALSPETEQWQAQPTTAPGDQDILQALEEVTAKQTPPPVAEPAPIAEPIAEPVVEPIPESAEVEPISFEPAPESAPATTEVELEPFSLDTDDSVAVAAPADPFAAAPEPVEQASAPAMEKEEALQPFESLSAPEQPEAEVETQQPAFGAQPEEFDFAPQTSEEPALSDVDPFAAAAAAESADVGTEFSFSQETESEPQGAAAIEPVAATEPVADSDPFSFSDQLQPESLAQPEPENVSEPVADLPSLDEFQAPTPSAEPVLEPEPGVAAQTVADDGVLDLREEDIVEEGVYASEPTRVEKRVAFLSDEQLTEIVERVAGAVIERLAAPVLEQVVWEVVPDLAESMVREEMAKIKPDA